MFTGIVAAVGRIEPVKPLGTNGDAGVRLNVEAGGLDRRRAIGDSITIQGACMTVVARTAHSFEVDVSRESLNRTAGLSEPGEVNLEKALRAPTVLAAISSPATWTASAWSRTSRPWASRTTARSGVARFGRYRVQRVHHCQRREPDRQLG